MGNSLRGLWEVLEIKESIFKGFILFLPLAIISYFLFFLFGIANTWGTEILKLLLPPHYVYPMSGLMLLALFLYLVGKKLRHEEKTGKYFLYTVLKKIPVISFFVSLVPKERSGPSFGTCLFQKANYRAAGIIQGTQRVRVGNEIFFEVIVLWLNPPTMVTGEICYLNPSQVVKLKNPLSNIVSSVTSLGLSQPEEFDGVPWENETIEECQERYRALRSLPPCPRAQQA